MSFRRSLGTIAALLIASGSALAGPQDTPDKPVLRGPAVKEGAAPGGAGSFGGQKTGKFAERPLPHMAFVRAFEVLRRDTTPQDARLNDEQEKSLREINAAFVQEQSQYFQSHRAEAEKFSQALGVSVPKERNERATRRWMEQLRAAAAPRGKKGDAKAKDAGDQKTDEMQMMTGDQAARNEAVAGLKALMEKAPKPEDTHAKMWAVLTEVQRPLVQQEIDSFRKGDRKDAKPGEVAPGQAERPMALLPEQLRERLRNLPPEERERIAQRLRSMPPEMRERLRAMDEDQRRQAIARYLRAAGDDARVQGKNKEGKNKNRPARKQAPDMNDVDVPPPHSGSPR